MMSGKIIEKTNIKKAVSYCFNPELGSRFRVATQRVQFLPTLVAVVLISTGLLPRDYLRRQYGKRAGLSQILAAAANNLSWCRQGIDRIVVFVAVVVSLIALTLQAVLIVVGMFVGRAEASTQIFSLDPAVAKKDIVLVYLDQLFGVPGIFDTGAPAVGSPLHAGIHSLLGFYSTAMMILATIIVMYYVITVVGEAAQSGTPFGRRFNGLWTPIRLVLALGLLVPLGSGLNAAQYLTLSLAKAGSSFASNAWSTFAEKATDPTSIITAPDVQASRGLVREVFLAEVCKHAIGEGSAPGQVRTLQSLGTRSIAASLNSPDAMISAARSAGQDSVAVSWTKTQLGSPITRNTCGRVAIRLDPILQDANAQSSPAERLQTALQPLANAYVGEIGRIVTDLGDAPRQFAGISTPGIDPALYNQDALLPTIATALNNAGTQSVARLRAAVETAYSAASSGGASRELHQKMVAAGWGGAGIWYTKFGQLNQKFQQAVRNGVPAFTEIVSRTPRDDDRGSVSGMSDEEARAQATISRAVAFVQSLEPAAPADSLVHTDNGQVVDSEAFWTKVTERPIETILNFVFRTEGLRLLRTTPTLDPMIVLVSAGDRMIQGSMAAFTMGMASRVIAESVSDSWFTSIPFIGTAIDIAAKTVIAFGAFFVATALIGFMAGVVLFYLLPLLPFVYFFFSIIGWGLSVVEAVVAGPLWALAHVRIDGEGMAGSGAIGGYYMLLEILLRPVLIVAGLIIGYEAFGVGAYMLSTIFDSVTNTLDASMVSSWLDTNPATDRGASSGIDNFIYTILFTIIVYGMALACFKLPDRLPDHIMRWMGAPGGTSPFAGGKDAPDMQGTVLAGGAAVHGISSGLQGAVTALTKKGNPQSGAMQAGPQVQGTPISQRQSRTNGTP